MPVEIERKFLVVSNVWRRIAARHVHIRDGLIGIAGNRKVRVRIADDAATLAVKSKVAKGRNVEFEYPIPLADAEYMLAHECDGNLLGKTRYFVPVGGLTWEVDVYDDPLKGVVLAEVELSHEDAIVELPYWIGEEATSLPEWKKINMLKAARARDARWQTDRAGD